MKICFSTEVVDLNNQAPNRNKRESKYFWDELYPLISVAGFRNIEVPYEPKWDFGGRSGIPRSMRSVTIKYQTVENYLKYLNSIGIDEITCVHLDPSLFCAGAVQMYLGAFGHFAEEAIEFAAQAKAECVTLTATACYYAVTKLMGYESEEGILEMTKGLVQKLADLAEEKGLKLCLKNEYWGLLRGEKIVSFVEGMKNVYIDADTAHLQIAGVDPVQFVKENAAKIGVVHFTDTSFVDDQEAYLQPLPEFPAKAAAKVICDAGEGKIDFAAIKKSLEESGYQGTVIYNCKNSYDIYRSILRTAYMNSKLN